MFIAADNMVEEKFGSKPHKGRRNQYACSTSPELGFESD